MCTLTGERLAELCAYCRIEQDALDISEERLLSGFYSAAVGYMTGAGIAEPNAGTPRKAQYDLCVNALVLDAWDHRAGTLLEQGVTVTDNPIFRRMLNQLKLSEPMVEEKSP